MGEDDQPQPPAQQPEPTPTDPAVPSPRMLPRHGLPKPHDDGPENGERRGLPTWMWVILSLLMIFVGLPLLAIGALFLYCTINPMRF